MGLISVKRYLLSVIGCVKLVCFHVTGPDVAIHDREGFSPVSFGRCVPSLLSLCCSLVEFIGIKAKSRLSVTLV
jgi:hypothetical protein